MDEDERKALEQRLRRELAELERQEKELISRKESLKSGDDGTVLPQKHQETKSPPSWDTTAILDGVTYILMDDDGNASREMFQKVLKKKGRGLLISRINPKVLMRKYDLGGATVCWMSKMRAGEDIRSVYGLQEISILINSHVEENPTSAVMVDGLEYLISNNDFNIVLRLIQQIRDKVSTTESILFLPVNPQVLEQKQMTLLKNECETL